MLATAPADDHGADGTSTIGVVERRKWLFPVQVLTTPFAQRNYCRCEVGARSRQHVLVANRPILVRDPFQNAMVNQAVEAIGQHVGGNAQLPLNLGVAALTEEDAAQDAEGPHVTKYTESPQDGAPIRAFDTHSE